MILGCSDKVGLEVLLVVGERVGVAKGEVVRIREDWVFDAADAFVEFSEALHSLISVYKFTLINT